MDKIKTLKYHFSVEGETEDWYLERLEDIINSTPSTAHKVSFDSKIEKNPLKRAKSITLLGKTEITHIVDYESNDDVHTQQFIRTLDLLKETSKLGKQIKYRLGYSNFTFELWIILHKSDCNGMLLHRRQYLQPINNAYGERFTELAQYKQEANFKRVLGKISLDDVKAAIERARRITEANETNGLVLHQYKGYRYYKENPSLSVWEVFSKILSDCKL